MSAGTIAIRTQRLYTFQSLTPALKSSVRPCPAQDERFLVQRFTILLEGAIMPTNDDIKFHHDYGSKIPGATSVSNGLNGSFVRRVLSCTEGDQDDLKWRRYRRACQSEEISRLSSMGGWLWRTHSTPKVKFAPKSSQFLFYVYLW